MKTIDKFMTCLTTGGIITMINLIFGKIDYSMIVLIIVMVTDFATGLMCGFKTKTLSSQKCSTGLFKKFFILIYVMLAHHFDVLLNIDYIRMAVCYTFIVSETLSIIENGTLIGVPVPEPIKKALDIINGKIEEGEKDE